MIYTDNSGYKHEVKDVVKKEGDKYTIIIHYKGETKVVNTTLNNISAF